MTEIPWCHTELGHPQYERTLISHNLYVSYILSKNKPVKCLQCGKVSQLSPMSPVQCCISQKLQKTGDWEREMGDRRQTKGTIKPGLGGETLQFPYFRKRVESNLISVLLLVIAIPQLLIEAFLNT